MAEIRQDHHKISPTAKLVSRIRAEYTNIPYAKEVYGQVENRDGANLVGPILTKIGLLSPSLRARASMLEGRYVSINEAISRLGDCSILELAAGISPRGLDYSKGGRLYIETDLPDIIDEKRRIVELIRKREGESLNNHYLMPLNVVDWEGMRKAGELFRKKGESKVAVIHEGLLGYLNRVEQRKARDNIARFLREYSPQGAWITNDFSTRGMLRNSLIGWFIRKRIERKTGRKFTNFANYDEVESFLDEARLKLEVLPNKHLVPNLSCRATLNFNLKIAEGFAEQYQACSITLA